MQLSFSCFQQVAQHAGSSCTFFGTQRGSAGMQLSWLCTQGCRNLEDVHTELWRSWNCARRGADAFICTRSWTIWSAVDSKKILTCPSSHLSGKTLKPSQEVRMDLVPFCTVFLAQTQSRQGTTFSEAPFHLDEQNVPGNIWDAILLLSRRCGITLIPCYESPFLSVFTMRWGALSSPRDVIRDHFDLVHVPTPFWVTIFKCFRAMLRVPMPQ